MIMCVLLCYPVSIHMSQLQATGRPISSFFFEFLTLTLWPQFTVQNPNELYVLVSSALPTTHRDMTCTVLKAT